MDKKQDSSIGCLQETHVRAKDTYTLERGAIEKTETKKVGVANTHRQNRL